jgi:hypothetical protein
LIGRIVEPTVQIVETVDADELLTAASQTPSRANSLAWCRQRWAW